MHQLTVSYRLREWRMRMDFTQPEAAEALGLSLRGYAAAEYASEDRPGNPCKKTYALLARLIEELSNISKFSCK